MNRILVLDNYDSFVYNLVHYLTDLDCEVIVKRNDEISLEEVKHFQKIVLSPGPGLPSEAGIMNELIQTYAATKDILGICLGHQAIAEVFGAKLKNLPEVFHGVAHEITINKEEQFLYKDLPRTIQVGRYHSWVINDIPGSLIPTAYDSYGNIMSFQHKDFRVYGIQFHPESILTPSGKTIIKNWLS